MADNRVLTDQEIDAAWNSNKGRVRDGCRAVEAAVLAKVFADKEPRVPPTFGCDAPGTKYVPEREARRRERAAWDAGLAELAIIDGPPRCTTPTYLAHRRDVYYHLPTVERPCTVTLSDGTTVRKNGAGGSGWLVTTSEEKASSKRCLTTINIGGDDNGLLYREALTPADARLLADLVEHPFEEVPDDA